MGPRPQLVSRANLSSWLQLCLPRPHHGLVLAFLTPGSLALLWRRCCEACPGHNAGSSRRRDYIYLILWATSCVTGLEAPVSL